MMACWICKRDLNDHRILTLEELSLCRGEGHQVSVCSQQEFPRGRGVWRYKCHIVHLEVPENPANKDFMRSISS